MEEEATAPSNIAFVYGDVCVRTKKERRKRQKLLIIEMLYDYARNSSLHGLRYIVERGLNIIEKLFWLITVIISVVLCSMLIYQVYMKWVTGPVIVAVNDRLSSVGTVPFPFVMICPPSKVKPSVYNYTAAERQPNFKTDRTKHINIASMCDNFGIGGNFPNVTNTSFIDDITKVALTQEDVFFHCLWKSSFMYCRDFFKQIYTQEGICFISNSLAAEEIFKSSTQSNYTYLDSNTSRSGWSPESGYNYSVKYPYPSRGHVLSSLPDIELILIHNGTNQDKLCNYLSSGYKIYLQHPADYAQSSLYHYSAIPNQDTSLAVSFHRFDADPNLSSYAPDIRQCYFPNERKLRYFNIYTLKNCQAECLSNYTYEMCKCVGFYMPHDNSSEICHPSRRYCMQLSQESMAESELNYELKSESKGCHCLPECNSIEYDAEELRTEFKFIEEMKQYELHDPEVSYSHVQLFFKKPQFVTIQRRELYGITDLLANIGGLMGLFLGFSFMSLFELLYYLTLRVGFTLRRDLEEEQKKKKVITEAK